MLQPLVENALRHGVAAMSDRGTVEIEARVDGSTLILRVTNDALVEAPKAQNGGQGVGLTNTRERLATLYGERARLSLSRDSGRVTAEIRLPYRLTTDTAPMRSGAAVDA